MTDPDRSEESRLAPVEYRTLNPTCGLGKSSLTTLSSSRPGADRIRTPDI